MISFDLISRIGSGTGSGGKMCAKFVTFKFLEMHENVLKLSRIRGPII